MSENKTKLGDLVHGHEGRDAVHVAIAPVVAGEDLKPGQWVILAPDGKAVPANSRWDATGIVDPFLQRGPCAGEKFWLCLIPGTVTGMRHEWSHPSFISYPASPTRVGGPSEQWIHDYAREVGVDYDELMAAADAWVKSREKGEWEYLCKGGDLEGITVREEFWTHYAAVTGKTGSGSFFTCSC